MKRYYQFLKIDDIFFLDIKMSDLDNIKVIEITSLEEMNKILSALNANDQRVQGIELTDQFVDRFNDLPLYTKRNFSNVFANALINNQTLKILIDPSRTIDTQTLAEALKKNNTLEELDLGLEVGDLKFLVEALKFNRSIYKLGLGDNPYDKEGLILLAKVLTTNSTLNELDLKNNGIIDEVAIFFAKALVDYDIMLILDLEGNKISPELENLIQIMLNNNEMSEDEETLYEIKERIFQRFEDYYNTMNQMWQKNQMCQMMQVEPMEEETRQQGSLNKKRRIF